MPVWSHSIQRIPGLGQVYKSHYFAWKRTYLNLLRATGIRPGPSVVHWLATFRCNANCVYCEANANASKCDELATREIVSTLDELQELRVRRFFVTGGEPLVRADLFQVLEAARTRGMEISMITNSLLASRFRAQIAAAGLSSIWTSVDGLEATHDKNRGVEGSYQITLAAIRFYKEIGIPLRVVNTLAHPGNLAELPALQEALFSAGINRWRLALAIPVGRAADSDWGLSAEQIQHLFDYVEQQRQSLDIELSEELGYLGCYDLTTRNSPFFCPAGLSFCVIMPDGHVLPCQVVYDNRFSEGNVRETSFREIWEQGFGSFRQIQLAEPCTDCIHRKACSGGCWGRLVHEGNCLRSVWDSENYGHPHLN